MSSKQHLHDHRRAGTPPAPVRVFDDVADTPRTPAPRWWNHPVAIMSVAMISAITVFACPYLPPLSGLVLAVTGVAMASGAEVNRTWWSTSRVRAAEEAVWVADQCGYALEAAGGELHWNGGGRQKVALLDHHGGGWRLSLYDAGSPAVGAGR